MTTPEISVQLWTVREHLEADPDATLPSLHLGLLHDPAARAVWQAATPHVTGPLLTP